MACLAVLHLRVAHGMPGGAAPTCRAQARTPHTEWGGGAIPPTDASTYGTHVNDVKLARKQPVRLAAGDALRLADRTKFRLARAPLALHDAHGTDAAVAAMAAAVWLRPVPWGPDVTHCLVEEGGPLNAAAAAALLGGAALVTRGWLEQIHSRNVWSGELPPAEPHAPTTLALLQADGTGGDALDVAAWEPPPEDALAQWVLVLLEEVGGPWHGLRFWAGLAWPGLAWAGLAGPAHHQWLYFRWDGDSLYATCVWQACTHIRGKA
jgi:hypothetical protein